MIGRLAAPTLLAILTLDVSGAYAVVPCIKNGQPTSKLITSVRLTSLTTATFSSPHGPGPDYIVHIQASSSGLSEKIETTTKELFLQASNSKWTVSFSPGVNNLDANSFECEIAFHSLWEDVADNLTAPAIETKEKVFAASQQIISHNEIDDLLRKPSKEIRRLRLAFTHPASSGVIKNRPPTRRRLPQDASVGEWIPGYSIEIPDGMRTSTSFDLWLVAEGRESDVGLRIARYKKDSSTVSLTRGGYSITLAKSHGKRKLPVILPWQSASPKTTCIDDDQRPIDCGVLNARFVDYQIRLMGSFDSAQGGGSRETCQSGVGPGVDRVPRVFAGTSSVTDGFRESYFEPCLYRTSPGAKPVWIPWGSEEFDELLSVYSIRVAVGKDLQDIAARIPISHAAVASQPVRILVSLHEYGGRGTISIAPEPKVLVFRKDVDIYPWFPTLEQSSVKDVILADLTADIKKLESRLCITPANKGFSIGTSFMGDLASFYVNLDGENHRLKITGWRFEEGQFCPTIEALETQVKERLELRLARGGGGDFYLYAHQSPGKRAVARYRLQHRDRVELRAVALYRGTTSKPEKVIDRFSPSREFGAEANWVCLQTAVDAQSLEIDPSRISVLDSEGREVAKLSSANSGVVRFSRAKNISATSYCAHLSNKREVGPSAVVFRAGNASTIRGGLAQFAVDGGAFGCRRKGEVAKCGQLEGETFSIATLGDAVRYSQAGLGVWQSLYHYGGRENHTELRLTARSPLVDMRVFVPNIVALSGQLGLSFPITLTTEEHTLEDVEAGTTPDPDQVVQNATALAIGAFVALCVDFLAFDKVLPVVPKVCTGIDLDAIRFGLDSKLSQRTVSDFDIIGIGWFTTVSFGLE